MNKQVADGSVPVLFIIFNRPDISEQTFRAIREYRPRQLFIAADGYRSHVQGEQEKCALARKKVLDLINWDCELHLLFQDSNMGCDPAVSTAISWFFSHVEEGIIFEDDCLPDPAFFTFCAQMLAMYRNDARVTHIGGTNFQCGMRRGKADYFFSCYSLAWGWATWRRAWNNFNPGMKGYEEFCRTHPLRKLMPFVWNEKTNQHWDTQWLYTNATNGGLSILPNVNLIRNIGFGDDATHTIHKVPYYIERSGNGALTFPLKHPARVRRNKAADIFMATFVFRLMKPTISYRLVRMVRKKLKMNYY